MRKIFTYSSEIEFVLPESHEELVEKMTLGLKKKPSSYSGEDADRTKSNLYFAITPNGVGVQFFGIDSGEMKIDVQGNKMIVRYRLSYLSPFLPFFVLDIFLIWLAYLFPSYLEVKAFSIIIAMFLFFWIIGILSTIGMFPTIIHGVWNSINSKVNDISPS